MRTTVLALLITGTLFGCGQATNDTSSLDTAPISSGPTDCPAGVQWANIRSSSSLNRNLLSYAVSHVGQKVGDGQCESLPDLGLRANGGKTFSQLGPTGADADYVWGTLVETISTTNRRAGAVSIGDVLQFRNFAQKVTNPNGSWWSSNAPHHTAIVKAVSTDATKLCVYEQNVNGRMTVGTGYIDLGSMSSGTIKVYVPTR